MHAKSFRFIVRYITNYDTCCTGLIICYFVRENSEYMLTSKRSQLEVSFALYVMAGKNATQYRL